MRTVVINTLKMQNEIRLDLLFGQPLDDEQLIWIQSEFPNIDKTAEMIEKRIFNNAQFIEKKINLIVLLSNDEFEFGKYTNIKDVYSDLMRLYVQKKLVDNLKRIDITDAAVIFVDSSTKPYKFLNPKTKNNDKLEEQIRSATEEALHNKEDFSIGQPIDYSRCNSENVGVETEDQQFRELRLVFDIDEFDNPSNFRPKVVFSHKDIDLSDIMIDVKTGIINSSESRDWKKNALIYINKELQKSSGIKLKEYNVRGRSSSATNFDILAFIDRCISEGCIPENVNYHSDEEIKEHLKRAYRKYKYYSDEKNMSADFNSLVTFEETFKEEINNEQSEKMQSIKEDINDYHDVFGEPLDPLVVEILKKEEPKEIGDIKFHGLIDKRIKEKITMIKEQYLEKNIEKQNRQMRDKCLVPFQQWRDQTTLASVRTEINKKSENTNDISNISLDFNDLKIYYDEQRNSDIEKIIDLQLDIAGYEDVLDDLEKCECEYKAIKNKEKRCWMALIGGILSIIILMIPYLVFYTTSGVKFLVLLPWYLSTMAVLSVAYLSAVFKYSMVLLKQKKEVSNNLSLLLKSSRKKRTESLEKIKYYYEKTARDIERRTLWWTAINEIYEEDLQIGRNRSIHLMRFKELVKITLSFAAKLKIKENEITEGAIYNTENKVVYPRLSINKSFYDVANRKCYSFFDDDTKITEEEISQNDGAT